MSQSKKCSFCGTVNDESVNFCTSCGGANFLEQTEAPAMTIASPEIAKKPNILLGIIGAFLFSIVGVAVFFGVYQLGYIAGICGFLIYWFASFGFGLFTGTKKTMTTSRLVTSILVMIVMIFVANFACITYDIIKALNEAYAEYGLSIKASVGEAVELIPLVLEDSGAAGEVYGNLAFSYLFAILSIIAEIVAFAKAKKAQINPLENKTNTAL